LSNDVSTLFDRDSDAWVFFPQISIPIFTGGRNKAQLKLAELRRDRHIVLYERAIQNAFREVADALNSHEKFSSLLEVRQRVMTSSQKTYELSRQRYLAGIDNYLVELDARRSLYEADRLNIIEQLDYLSNLAYLYRTLG